MADMAAVPPAPRHLLAPQWATEEERGHKQKPKPAVPKVWLVTQVTSNRLAIDLLPTKRVRRRKKVIL